MGSPSVITQERDFTFTIQSVTSNGTGYAGMFRWGPAEEIVEITTNESELVSRFFQPDSATTLYFHAAANYLLYSVPLLVSRAIGTGSLNSVPTGQTAILVKNESYLENAPVTGISFIGKYPGALGNSLKVSVANSAGFTGWAYEDEFNYAPSSATEFNVVVIDEDGEISGTAGTILEKFELLQSTPGTKKTDGTTAYYLEAMNKQSKWLFVGDTASLVFTAGIYETSFVDGADDNVLANAAASFTTSYALFDNVESVDIMRTFTSGASTAQKGTVIDSMESRGDAIAFVGPELTDVYNNSTVVDDLVTYFTATINKNNSYWFKVDNWKMIYDKYNDKNIWIPCDSDAAGLHARTVSQQEAWFSPAGLNRGGLKNVIKLAWNSNKIQRDKLYKYHINSIVSFPGEGIVLFGDKTGFMAPSAFSRINVRSLFIVIKKAIATAARYQLFELNDFITRSLFRNATDQYLESVQARRGIYDRKVICDDSNNTPQVIDSNQFVGDILVKPARSINEIILRFSAVATGVSFDEIEVGF